MAELPEGVYEQNGLFYRDVERTSGEGQGDTWTQHRPVALTLSEAKSKHWDWFHPQFGWLLEGYKLEKDRDASDILADGSEVVIATPETQEQLAETEGA